ncbi:hypothetical protein N4P33_15115 [Streptomyces sp. 15-116A]|uniref:hypothetical protein n=1 Tax=Streptomyces sp. 15-116A TaxID=2259035 RepID=UPI0021B1DD80|nr:hypothetical protein [Streptomyces sp. 15-116A]MCT7353497.1 hypothetical protein [Streptomyces sp. 15-116A]
MASEQPVCRTCGQPVESVVRRHKTLGAWVPVWTAGPCRNPDCGKPGAHPQAQERSDKPPVSGSRPVKQ